MNHKLRGVIAAMALSLLALTACGQQGGTEQTESPAETTAAGDVDLMTADSPLGEIVVDSDGMTLYYFTRDTANSGVSACEGQCLIDWPPMLTDNETPVVEGVTGEVGTIEGPDGPDGQRWVTLNGMPLYYWIRDNQPGDVTGQDVGQVWYVVAPDGTMITDPLPATESPSPTEGTTEGTGGAAGEGAADLAVAESEAGQIVVNGEGLSVYYYTRDTANSGVSACTGGCLQAWPPVTTESDSPSVEGVTGEIGTIDTPDGQKQITINGMPIYLYAEDQAPGDIIGQGVGDVWYLVAPDGTMMQ